MPEPSDFDRLKYELDKRKVELDERRFQAENNLFNKNFGVIITGIVSAAAIVVSLVVSISQMRISSSNSSSQLKIEREKNDRSFQFDIAKFLLEQKAEINTADVAQAKYIRNVVVSLFPQNFAAQVSASMQVVSEAPDIRRVWADGLAYSEIKTLPVTPVSTQNSTLTAEQIATEYGFEENRKNEINSILASGRERGIASKNEVDLFIALVLYNSNFLRLKDENLSYSASRLQLVFPAIFKTPEEAQQFANNPEKIANRVYSGRLGNHDPGDGFKYRGRGYLQITGRDNYREIGNAVGIDLEANPDQLLDPPTNAKVAAYLFSKTKQTGTVDLLSVNRAINGGIAGLDSTKAIYERIRKLTA